MRSKKYRSDARAAIHETMEALRHVGAIDEETMRRFDKACLHDDPDTDAGGD